MKNIKKTLLIVVAMILMCAMSAAVTLALYHARTDELKNTFTFGSVSIKLDETDPDNPNTRVEKGVEYDIDPGITYVKDPKITNTSDEKAWVRMTVTFNHNVATEFNTDLAGFVVGVETADVETAGGHGPGVHHGLFYHIVGQVAGGVFATSVLDTVTDEVEVFFPIYIERWNGPVALGLLGLLFHIEDAVMLVHDNDTGALELLDARLLVAHDAAGSLLLGKVDELLKAEEEEVVGGENQQVWTC